MIRTHGDKLNGARKDPTKCFYCGNPQPEHTPECHVPRKAIVVRMTVDVVIEEPAVWTKEQIEFHLNQSTYCGSNVLHALAANDTRCICFAGPPEENGQPFTVLRDATEEDIERLPMTFDKSEAIIPT